VKNADNAVRIFRRTMKPFAIVTHHRTWLPVELVCYPYVGQGGVPVIMARAKVGDPGTLMELCCDELRPIQFAPLITGVPANDPLPYAGRPAPAPRFTWSRIAALVLVFAALLALAQLASAATLDGLRVEGGVGDCRFSPSPPGQWWQPDHEHSNDYKDHCGEIGASLPVASVFGRELRLGARYVTLGRAHTRAIARTFDNDDAKLADASLDPQREECHKQIAKDCDLWWTGDGGAKGLEFALTYELLSRGPFRLEGEAGAYVHQIKWNNQVYPLGCPDTSCAYRVTVNQKSDYQISPVVGLRLFFELSREDKLDLFVGFQEFLRIGEHTPVTAGVKGPVEKWTFGIAKTF
jgi:hypothetical protein